MRWLPDISPRLFRVWQRDLDVHFATKGINLVVPLVEPLLYVLAFGAGLGTLVGTLPYRGEPVSYIHTF